ncbi:MAG: FAD-dependent oxidoreductase [Kiloniellales bacterium]|nr:FAD-dependent oxidoreductase [Kiloniellales bacterium]
MSRESNGEDAAPAARDPVPVWAAGTETRHAELYPTLNDAQLAAIAGYGREESFEDGALLWDVGERDTDFYVVLDGKMEIVARRAGREQLIVSHGRGRYSGETVTLSGRAALVAGRAKGRLKVLALTAEALRDLVAKEAGLGEVIVQSFILRRMRMIAERFSSVIVVGSRFSRDTQRIRRFLTRNGMPHEFVDLETSEDVADFLGRFEISADETPIVIAEGHQLKNPGEAELAESLGFAQALDACAQYDTAVIGAGPAGLAAAVYAASEGLDVVVLEREAPGGQAGTSSKIENYLGFPTGISGQALAGRAFMQAQKFGAEVVVPSQVASLAPGAPLHEIALADGRRIRSRSVVIASGAVYRKPPIESLERFVGSGVYYGAGYVEAQLCKDQEVAIVGGGNSAGQAAVFLSDHARKVRILVRGPGLAASMSRYLIRRIETTGNIELMTHTEIVDAEGRAGSDGEDRLAAVVLKDNRSGETRRLDLGHVFIFIGAAPSTDFVAEGLVLDDKGFVKTGIDLTPEELRGCGWPLNRQPFLLEASIPGVFATGDVRAGSIKRVASAVGEGSVAVQFIHRVLAE